MEIGISVVICCYNSAKRLPDTLQHLLLQKFSLEVEWEVIVVNNNSNDDTRAVAHEFILNNFLPANINAVVVDEPIPGLTAAREKGIAVSRHNYVLFCDDDNWLEEHFISKLYGYLLQHGNDNIGVIGSLGHPIGEVTLPSWMPSFQAWYATGEQSDTNGDITYKRPVVFGAASVLNKKAYQEICGKGFKSFLTDRLGTSLSSGGDIEICMALALSGYRIFYFSDLQFGHYLNAQRLEKKYIQRMSKEGAISAVKLLPYTYLWRKIEREPKHFTVLYLSSIHLFRLPKLFKNFLISKFKGNEDEQFESQVSFFDEINLWKAKIKARKELKEQYFLLRKAKWIKNTVQKNGSI